MHTGLGGNTINNVKRVIVIQGTCTTDADSSSTRGVTVGRDVHARHATLHRLDGVVLVLFHQIGYTDYTHGAGQVGLALCGITGHDNLVEGKCILFHGDNHAIAGWHLNIEVAHIGENERCSGIYFDGEGAVKVGHCTISGTFLNHSGADDGFSCLVNDGACDFCLRIQNCTRQHEHEAE